MEFWAVFLSSTVVSGIVGVIVSGWFNLRAKRHEYENMYFKMVLDKRLAAYTDVETFLSFAGNASVDDKGRTYHAMFEPQEDGLPQFWPLHFKAMSGKLWLSDDLHDAIRAMNIIAYPAGDNQQVLLTIAKDKYKEIAELRARIEYIHSRDMLTLFKIPEFLKSKKPSQNVFETLPPRASNSSPKPDH